jgi:hypothetical protein
MGAYVHFFQPLYLIKTSCKNQMRRQITYTNINK